MAKQLYALTAEDVAFLKSLRKNRFNAKAGKPLPRRDSIRYGSGRGCGRVTTQITAASVSTSTQEVTWGVGQIELYYPKDGTEDIDEPSGIIVDIYTSVEESTPVDKYVHYYWVNNRRVLCMEPCNVSNWGD